MKRLLLALGFIGALGGSAAAQTPPTVHPCYGSPCVGVSTTNPLPTTGTFTPSGTQNVNLTQILSAPPSLTNPLWVFPATGASFAVTGTFFQATQPVSGTVTANQGTPGSAWPVTLASTAITGNTVVIGPTADGSPATTAPVLIAGTADGSASGNVSVAKVDAAGLVYAAITNWGGTALGAMANYGTSPGAVLVPGVNAFITNTVAVTNAPSAASTSGLTPTTTSALAANSVIKASAGNLYSFEVAADSTLSAAAWWIMIYNATSAPGDGAVTPLKCYAMPSGTTSFAAAFPTPVAFSTGITIGVSTNGCFTKAASTHAFISGDAQ